MTLPHPTPYPELDAVLHELVHGARAALGERFTGAYLLGSFGLGEFDEHSDVDFLVAIRDDVPEAEVDALQALHRRIYALPVPWAKRLDGSYVPEWILRRHDPTGTALLYLDHGSRELVRSAHCNRLVIRWMVRERGITLAGPEPTALIDPVPIDAMRAQVAHEMRAWTAEIRAEPEAMNNRHYQPYAVLSFCRMLCTLATGQVVSKPAGAAWARRALDGEWHALIEHALAARADPALRFRQPADPDDLAQTPAFLDYALARSEALRRALIPRP